MKTCKRLQFLGFPWGFRRVAVGIELVTGLCLLGFFNGPYIYIYIYICVFGVSCWGYLKDGEFYESNWMHRPFVSKLHD
jgi:hypothetical protein